MTTAVERLLARTTRVTKYRPLPPREGRFDDVTNLLTWHAPRRSVGAITHYRIRIEDDRAAPQYQPPVGQTTLQLTAGITRVFISTYNQINGLESPLLPVYVTPRAADAPLPPGNVIIDDGGGGAGAGPVKIRYYNGKALVSISYISPMPLGDFDRVHVYLYAPDTVIEDPAALGDVGGFIVAADASEAEDASKLPSKVGGPVDKGNFPYDPDDPIVHFEHPAPPIKSKKCPTCLGTGTVEEGECPTCKGKGELPDPVKETWRAVLVSGSPSVPENPIETSPFVLFEVQQPIPGTGDQGTDGAEYGPNFRNGQGWWYEDNAFLDAQMFPTWWFTLKWENPVEDPRWERVVAWQLWVYDPLKANDPDRAINHGFQRVSHIEKNATTYVLDGRWNLTQTPNDITLYLVPQDIDGNVNSLVKGVNDIVKFTVSTVRGLQLQYADGSIIDGIDFEASVDGRYFRIKNLDLTKVYGPSYSAEFKVVDGKFQWGDDLDWKKFDPAKLGQPFDLNQETGFLDFPFDPAHFDASTGEFAIIGLPPGAFSNTEFGTDENGNIIITGVDFTKALPGTFTSEFVGGGAPFSLGIVSADKIKTGVLEVGGVTSGGQRVSRLKIFDITSPTPNLIGWIGDDSDASGYVGAWFKRVLIGGTSPADALVHGMYADANGNVFVPGSVVTGQLAAGVIYVGAIKGTQINSDYINVGGGSPPQPGQIFVYSASNALIGWIGTYLGWEGGWLKRLQLGGDQPANAKIAIDAFGNVAIKDGSLTAPNILNSQLNSATITASSITSSTLVLNTNGITTSIQNQGSLAPVSSTYIGIRVYENSTGKWTGLSPLGLGAFHPTEGFAILFSDALQVYKSDSTPIVRLGPSSSGGNDPNLKFRGTQVVGERYTGAVSDTTSIIACLRHHGLCN